jgi:hypothetical protein
MLIPVIGPPKAGMTPTVQRLWLDDLIPSVQCKDFDGVLKKRNRSNGAEAIALMELCKKSAQSECILVDVGAAQLIAQDFLTYLTSMSEYPKSVAVVWCDEETSVRRHGNAAEVRPYYASKPLTDLWTHARVEKRLIDTSGNEDPAQWAQELANLIQHMSVGK